MLLSLREIKLEATAYTRWEWDQNPNRLGMKNISLQNLAAAEGTDSGVK